MLGCKTQTRGECVSSPKGRIGLFVCNAKITNNPNKTNNTGDKVMYRRILFSLFALFVATIIAQTLLLAEQISISPWPGNSYTIPPSQTTNPIRFDFTATGLSNNLYYGWSYRLDGGSWSNVTNIGFGGNGTYSSYFTLYLGEGPHTVDIRLLRYDYPPGLWAILATASTNVTLTKQYSVTVQNSFGAGNVKVDGVTYASGTSFTWNSGTTHTLEAINLQNSGGYIRHFNNWSTGASTLSITINVSQNDVYTANFSKEFNIAFQNSLPGAGNGGVIKVNGAQYGSPTPTFAVVEPNTITGEALYQVINGIEYTFSTWSPGGSTSASTVFTPSGHTTYTANFNAKPLPPPGVSAGGSVGSYVKVTWSEHPHTSVTQYQIWRKVKRAGQQQEDPPQLLTTVNRGTTSYTDYAYTVTEGYTHDLVWYDV